MSETKATAPRHGGRRGESYGGSSQPAADDRPDEMPTESPQTVPNEGQREDDVRAAATLEPSARQPRWRRSRWAPLLPAIGLIVVAMGWYAATDWPMFRRSFEAPRWGYCRYRVDAALLDESLRIGTEYMLHHQRAEGSFDYEFDWIRGTYSAENRQVRQAGALWSLSLLHREQADESLAQAVRRGLDFYRIRSTTNVEGQRCIDYPGASVGMTGTVALVALSILDGLSAFQGTETSLPAVLDDPESPGLARVQRHLDQYLRFLESARHPGGGWHCCYDRATCRPHGKPSPYADGEALLALVKAARILDRRELEPLIRAAAADGYRINVEEALASNRDSDTTKGYYQSSTMAFYELYTSGWPDTEIYGDWVLRLADWMVDVHNPLARSRNTAYAIEGIAHAYDVAKRRGDDKRLRKYGCVIDTVLEQLTSWQVGSPIANRFIASHPTQDPLAIGGVQNEPHDSKLRIDVTQHQMHAALLARRFVYAP